MKYKLSEIALFNPTETIKKGSLAKKIGMDKLQSFCRDIPDYEIAEFTGGTKFRNGDTIMARITPCLENGKTAKVNVLADDEIGFIEVGKEWATDFMQLLTANENANPQGFFEPTYIFEDVLNIPFCYRDRGTTLWLAIGDKTGFKNMNNILFNWRTMATDYYNMEESDPLGLVYMVWSKRENSKNQIWWKLNEK